MSSGGSAFMARQLSSPWQRDRGFESPSLHRGVMCEPEFLNPCAKFEAISLVAEILLGSPSR